MCYRKKACNSRTRREMYEYSDARTTSSQLPIIVVRKRDTQQVDGMLLRSMDLLVFWLQKVRKRHQQQIF